MPQETENVTGNPESPQQNEDPQKETVEELVQVSGDNDSQPSVQEEACVLKQHLPRSPVAEATEEFLQNEKGAYHSEAVVEPLPVPEPRTPSNSEASEVTPQEEPSTAPQVVEVLVSETIVFEAVPDEPVTVNEISFEPPTPVTNGQTNGECKFEPRKIVESEPEPINNDNANRPQVLNGTIASELVAEDYRLPDVVEVKKHFEYVEPALGQNIVQAPPKKGALSTNLDSRSVRQAYQDVRYDGSDTQWAVFKFQGPTIVTSATGADFAKFKTEFGDDERAFGYIRVQTGDEMSKRAKFMFLTWVGPSVSVLKRAKMSTDKALIKDIISNFAVELQTENIADINLPNFEAVLDKAAGAHYGTGVRS